MRCAGERLDALDHDALLAGALDAGPHRVQQLRQVRDLRLAGAVLQHRRPSCQRGGHHQVLGPGHGRYREPELGADQPVGASRDVAVLELDLGAERLEARQVLVDRAHADRAAARQRDSRVSEPGQEGPQDQHAGAHRLDQVVGRVVDGGCALDLEPDTGGRGLAVDAEMVEQAQHRADVAHIGHSEQLYRPFSEQARRQGGQSGVLGTTG